MKSGLDVERLLSLEDLVGIDGQGRIAAQSSLGDIRQWR
jgi:hypothetical protein